LHFSDLLRERHQTIVVQDEALQARQLTNGGREVAQLVAAKMRRKRYALLVMLKKNQKG
jgi:hypothetical protein